MINKIKGWLYIARYAAIMLLIIGCILTVFTPLGAIVIGAIMVKIAVSSQHLPIAAGVIIFIAIVAIAIARHRSK